MLPDFWIHSPASMRIDLCDQRYVKKEYRVTFIILSTSTFDFKVLAVLHFYWRAQQCVQRKKREKETLELSTFVKYLNHKLVKSTML